MPSGNSKTPRTPSARRATFACAALAIFLGACSTWRIADTEINPRADEVCWQWGDTLPTKSQSDSAQTRYEISINYAAFSIICPDLKHLIPD